MPPTRRGGAFASGERAFSIIELLVVVGIVGALSAVGVPKYSEYKRRAADATALALLRNVITAQEAREANGLGYANCFSASDCGTVLGVGGLDAKFYARVISVSYCAGFMCTSVGEPAWEVSALEGTGRRYLYLAYRGQFFESDEAGNYTGLPPGI